jgi:hypothetical protein
MLLSSSEKNLFYKKVTLLWSTLLSTILKEFY